MSLYCIIVNVSYCRNEPEVSPMGQDLQSSKHVAGMACDDIKTEELTQSLVNADEHRSESHMKNNFHSRRPFSSSQLNFHLHPEFLHPCNDQVIDRNENTKLLHPCKDEIQDRNENTKLLHPFNDEIQDRNKNTKLLHPCKDEIQDTNENTKLLHLCKDEVEDTNENTKLPNPCNDQIQDTNENTKLMHTNDYRELFQNDRKISKKSVGDVRQLKMSNKLYQCNMCRRKFSCVVDLTKHAEKAHCPSVILTDVRKKLQCQHCGLYFATEAFLEMHFTSAHKHNTRNDKDLNEVNGLLEHDRDHPSPSEKIMAINKSTKIRVLKVSQSPPFKSALTMSKEDIFNAQMIIDGKIFFKCKICEKHVRCEKTLIEHFRIHTGEKPYTCHVCGRQFRLLSQLTRHVSDVHEHFRKHPCNICGRRFANRAALRDHTTIHTGERSMLCHLCGKSFKTKASLFMHSKFHVEGYPYPCPHCEKGFRVKGQLNNHILRHTGERPHECKHCGKRFFTTMSLKNHVLIHTNKQTYKCSQCGNHFSQARYLKNHERKHKKAVKKISLSSDSD